MLTRNTTFTIGSKFIILLANFVLVIFSTHIWGSEGRGEIALVLANVSIITIFSNVFCGSTVAYHAPSIQREFLFSSALAGAILISIAGSVLFSLFFGFIYFWKLFLIALLLSAITAISSYWLGKNNIRNYNLITIISPLAILLTMGIIYVIFKKTDIDIYFQAYYFGTSAALIIGISGLALTENIKVPALSISGVKSVFQYGVSNEFNYLIQFLNYRLAYYFIARMLGLSDLGVFSIVISVSEAVWIISRSMSAIHFSNVVNSDDKLKNRIETKQYARQSFWISLLILSVSIFIPKSIYQVIFGEEFGDVKKYIILLIPGVLAIAVSNLYGHYFAGTGNLRILRNKSLLGLLATLILLPLLLKKYQLPGVCISLDISYLISSFYLWFKFRREELPMQTET